MALEVHRDALSVSHSVIRWGSGVLTVVDGNVELTPVEFGASSFDRWEVISGLREGDLVITGLADAKQKQPDWRRRPRVEIVEPAAK